MLEPIDVRISFVVVAIGAIASGCRDRAPTSSSAAERDRAASPAPYAPTTASTESPSPPTPSSASSIVTTGDAGPSGAIVAVDDVGPYPALSSFCADLVAAHRPVVSCVFGRDVHAGPPGALILEADLVRVVGDAGAIGAPDLYVAVRTIDGWYVGFESVVEPTTGGGAGIGFYGTYARTSLAVEDFFHDGRAIAVLHVVETTHQIVAWNPAGGAPGPPADLGKETGRSTTDHAVLCAVGASRAPTCTRDARIDRPTMTTGLMPIVAVSGAISIDGAAPKSIVFP